jgi:hypothetical protein
MKSIIFWNMTPYNPLSFNRWLACWTYFFNPEDGGDMFLRNVGWISTDYTASHPRRWYSSKIRMATGPCAVPFTRWQLLDCEVVGERQWPVKTKMFEFTGMVSCCPTGMSSYWLMCLHRDSTWHPVTGHLNWPSNWHRVKGLNGLTCCYVPLLQPSIYFTY